MDVDTITLTAKNAPSSYSTVSSYGLASPYSAPVAVIIGQAYGPADIVMGTGKQAGDLVREWAERFCQARLSDGWRHREPSVSCRGSVSIGGHGAVFDEP